MLTPPPRTPPASPTKQAVLDFALSQSKIKKLTADKLCPLRFLQCDLQEQYDSIPSAAMLRGQLFEYLAFGSLNREHQVPSLPRTSRNKITAEEKRVILQASEMKRLLPLYGMELLDVCVPLSLEWEPGLMMNMLLDAFIWWNREPDPETGEELTGLYVLDAKLTGSVHNSYGDYCWGEPWNMNHLQAHVYMESAQRILSKHYGKPIKVGFVYAVFDYSTKMEHKIIEIRRSLINQGEMKELIRRGRETLQEIADEGFAPRPHYDLCKTCPVPDCPVRALVPPVQIVR